MQAAILVFFSNFCTTIGAVDFLGLGAATNGWAVTRAMNASGTNACAASCTSCTASAETAPATHKALPSSRGAIATVVNANATSRSRPQQRASAPLRPLKTTGGRRSVSNARATRGRSSETRVGHSGRAKTDGASKTTVLRGRSRGVSVAKAAGLFESNDSCEDCFAAHTHHTVARDLVSWIASTSRGTKAAANRAPPKCAGTCGAAPSSASATSSANNVTVSYADGGSWACSSGGLGHHEGGAHFTLLSA